MALPPVAKGDPHVSAHNAERTLLNGIQDISDPAFKDNLESNIVAKLGDVADPDNVTDILVEGVAYRELSTPGTRSHNVVNAIVALLIEADVPPMIAEQIVTANPEIAALAAALAQSDAGLVHKTDPGIPNPANGEVQDFLQDYLAASLSPLGRLLHGIRTDGTFEVPALRQGDNVRSADHSDDYMLIAESLAKRLLMGIRTDGSVQIPVLRHGERVVYEDPMLGDWQRLTITPSGRMLEDALDDSGRVPSVILQAWAERMGWGGAPVTTLPLDIIVVGGQSNSTQPDTTPEGSGVESDPDALYWNSTTGQPVVIPTSGGNSMGLAAWVARAWRARYPNRRVLVVETGVGSAGFRSTSLTPAPAGYRYRAGVGTWDRNFTANTGQTDPIMLYQRMVDRAQAAMAWAVANGQTSPSYKGVVFSLGEDDTNNQDDGSPRLTQVQFAAYQDDLVSQMRTDLGVPKLPFIWGSLVPEHYESNAANDTNVRRALVDAPRRLTGTGYIYGPENMHKFNNFRIHFTAQGQRVRGSLATEAIYRARLNYATTEPMPPQFPSIKRSGTEVKITWDFPPCRVTAFQAQISTDAGVSWVDLPLDGPLATDSTATVASGTPAWVRIRTTNEVGTSDYGFIVKG